MDLTMIWICRVNMDLIFFEYLDLLQMLGNSKQYYPKW